VPESSVALYDTEGELNTVHTKISEEKQMIERHTTRAPRWYAHLEIATHHLSRRPNERLAVVHVYAVGFAQQFFETVWQIDA
jgi:hypothetical protein